MASLLQTYADAGLDRVERVSAGRDKQLRETVGDIRAMAWLGRYYAEKIPGAVDLYRAQKSGDARHHQNARAHLLAAAAHWKQYADIWSTQYVGQVLTRMGSTPVDMRSIQTFVDRDVPAPMAAR